MPRQRQAMHRSGGPDAGREAHGIPLAPLPRRAWIFLAALAAALALIGLLLPADTLPGPGGPLLPFGLALLMAVPALALRRRRVTIEGDQLVVAATFFTRRVPVSTLDLAHARTVDLAERPELGAWPGGPNVDLPGLRAGHCLLRNRQRAFCLVTARERVLVLPERGGRLLILSPLQPRETLERLRRIAPAPARG